MLRHLFVCGIAWSAAFVTGFGNPAAAQSTLALFPEKAPIVFKIPGVDTLQKKLGDFLDKAVPEQAKKLKPQMQEGLKLMLDGRDTTGIAKDKPVYGYVADFQNFAGNDPPHAGIIVPITKYKDFLKVFTEAERKTLKKDGNLEEITIEDHSVFLLDKGDKVLLATEKAVATDYAAKFASLEAKLSADIVKNFDASDICVLVNMAEINNMYGAEIKQGKALVDLVLGQAGAQLDKAQLEMTKDLILGLFQIVEDSKAFLISFTIKPEGIGFQIGSQFAKDTDTSAFLKDAKPNALGGLDSLPAGSSMYSAVQFSTKLNKAFGRLMQQSLADDTNEDTKAKILKAYDALSAAGQIDQYSYAEFAPVSGLTINKFDNGEAALAATMQVFSTLNDSSKYSNLVLKSKPKIKEGAEKVGKLSFNSLVFDFDLDKSVDNPNLPDEAKELSKNLTKQMLGGESMKIWIAQDGKNLVQIVAKDWAVAKKTAEQYVALSGGKAKTADSLGAMEAFNITRKGLPPENTMMMLMESTSLISAIYTYAKELPKMIPGGIPGGFEVPNLKIDKNAPKSFFGLSVLLKPEHGSINVFVPSLTIGEIVKTVKPLMNQGD